MLLTLEVAGMGNTDELGPVANALLVALYDAYYTDNNGLMNDEVRQAGGWASADFLKALDLLEERQLAKLVTSGPCYDITWAGIRNAEQAGLVPRETVELHDTLRTQILKGFAESEPAPGSDGDRQYSEILEPIKASSGAPCTLVEKDLEILFSDDCGYLEGTSIGFFRVTRRGRAAFEDSRKRQTLRDTFKGLRNSQNPQDRGRRFQTALGELVRSSGWHVDEGVTAVGEETDLLLTRGDSAVFSECRWKKDPSEASEIRDFLGKLKKRFGALGAFFSMAGYSEGAEEEVGVHNNSGSNPTVLFGPREIEGIFMGNAKFDDLFRQKRLALLKRREAKWE
jgi:hypothetical protein